MIDIENITVQRVSILEDNEPDLKVDYEIEEGDHGLIILSQDDEPIGFEFIETNDSWGRPDALTQYHELASEGYYVGVIVPEESFLSVVQRIYSLGEMDITILTYRSVGLMPVPMAS